MQLSWLIDLSNTKVSLHLAALYCTDNYILVSLSNIITIYFIKHNNITV